MPPFGEWAICEKFFASSHLRSWGDAGGDAVCLPLYMTPLLNRPLSSRLMPDLSRFFQTAFFAPKRSPDGLCEHDLAVHRALLQMCGLPVSGAATVR